MDLGIDDISANNYPDDTKFRKLVEASVQGVIVIGLPDWKPLLVSESVARMYGYGSAEEMMNLETLAVIVHPEDRARLKRQDKVFKTDTSPSLNEFRGIRKDGSIIHVQDMVTPIEWNGERALIATSKDVTRRRRAEEAVDQAEMLREHAERIAHLGSWEIDYGENQVQWSDEVYRILGVDRESFDGRQESFMKLVHVDDRPLLETQQADIAAGRPYEYTYRIVRPDGEERIVQVGGEVIRMDGIEPLLARGFIHDITERKAGEDALRESEANLAKAQEIARLGSWTWDIVADQNYWSTEHYRIFGLDPDEPIVGYGEFLALVHDDDREAVNAAVEDALRSQGSYDIEFRFIRPDGENRVAHSMGVVEVDEAGKPIRMSGTVHDITERKRAEDTLAEAQAELKRQALYDQLTGLANRNLFLDRLDQAFARAKREDSSFCLLFLDLDGFKEVNDTFGHVAGDAILEEIGRRLSLSSRQTDTIARIGGDEFAVLLENGARLEGAERLAQKFIDAIRVPFDWNDQKILLGVSIGIATYPADGADADAIMESADSAMYAAKKTGGGYKAK